MAKPVRIFIGSLVALIILFGLGLGGLVLVLRTSYGHEKVREILVATLKGRVNGSVHIGKIEQGLFNGITLDSFAIRGPDDSLFVSTGRVTLRYRLGDLIHRKFVVRASDVQKPYVHIKQYEDGDWNFRRIFRTGVKSSVQQSNQKIAEQIIVESTAFSDGSFILTLPWHAPRWARGAVLDSIIDYELNRDDIDIRRDGQFFSRTWEWREARGLLVSARLSDPDFPEKIFELRDVQVAEYDPPFNFRNVVATVKQLGDSVWVDVPHFDLPHSTGNGKGKIVWGSDLPIRYDFKIRGDSVAMEDIAWIHPSLPATGGGRANLEIKNNPSNLHQMQYVISDMDVRSERSRLTGNMTFELGADTLIVKNVDIGMLPVNFDLLRRLNQGPFPLDWQGDITGVIRASGGNLARFKVEHADFTFADANVPGAVARGRASGGVNIFDPAFTEFRELHVDLDQLDLRTLQYVNPDFARLAGNVSGSAILDSSWLDVRFRNAELIHKQEGLPRSGVRGEGRITWGDEYLRYDVSLYADSLAMSTIRKSYELVPLIGKYSGPIRVRGEAYDLEVDMDLAGTDGRFTYEGNVDLDLPQLGASGNGIFRGFDINGFISPVTLPRTSLNGNFAVHVTGDSLSELWGNLSVGIDSSGIEKAVVHPSILAVRFDSGTVLVDTATLNTDYAWLSSVGTYSLLHGNEGRLDYRVDIDSIGRFAQTVFPKMDQTVEGRLSVTGKIQGALDSLDIDGKVAVEEVRYGGFRMMHTDLDFSLDNILYAPAGFATATTGAVYSAQSGDHLIGSIAASLQVFARDQAAFRIKFNRDNMVTAEGIGDIGIRDSTTEITLTSAELFIDSANTYMLSAPTSISLSTKALLVDSLIFGRQTGGSIAIRNVLVSDDSLAGTLRTSPLELAVLELFTSEISASAGTIEAAIDLRGKLDRPEIIGAITVNRGSVFVPALGIQLERVKGYLALEGDTIRIQEVVAETDKDRRGILTVNGVVGIGDFDNPTFSINAEAHNLRLIDRRGLASLDISTAKPVVLHGTYNNPVVNGGFDVDRGTIYIPELIRKQVLDINDPDLYDVIDTAVVEDRPVLLGEGNAFLKNLRLENVDIAIGDDVWLRSAEANIKLGGALTVVQGSAIADSKNPFTLQGELHAVRGIYRLNVVPLVQPTFEVESGTLRFFGSANLDPTLNITAVNTVRKPQQSVMQQDIRIRATIGGTLSSPTLTLSSADNLPLTQSDLLSYLITGEPAFALDYTTRTYVNQLAAVVIRSAGNVLSSAIPRSVFDVVELQTPGAHDDTQSRIDNPTLYNLLNTRAIFGKQLNSNVFLNLSTGLCAENFGSNLGFRLEYRLNRTYRLLFGLEPGSSELTCAGSVGSGGARSVQQTPPQFGFDLFRTWRF